MSQFIFAVDQTNAGTVTATASESPITGVDIVFVNSGVTVTSTGGDVFFTAGDDEVIEGTVQATAPGHTVSMTAGFADTDNEGVITLTSGGTISATNVTLSALTGMTLSGTITATTLDVSNASGGIGATNSNITAGRLQSTGGVTGDVSFTGDSFDALGDFKVTNGFFTLTDNVALTVNGPLSATADISIADAHAITHTLSTTTQTLTLGGAPTGTFSLTFNGQTTTALAATATAAAVQNALMNLSTVGEAGGTVAVGKNGSTYTITFGGTLAMAPPLLTSTGSGGTVPAVAASGDSTISGADVTLIADHMALDAGAVTATGAIVLV